MCTLNAQYFVLGIQNCVGTDTQSILACVLSEHRCAWKFWFSTILCSKFYMQSRFYICNQAACCLWVGDVKKIDVKPIFTVTETLPILALFHETVKIGEASIFLDIYCNRQDCKLIPNSKASGLRNIGAQRARKHFFQPKWWVRTCQL